MMKFKKGDRVKVRADSKCKGGALAGKAGTIVKVEHNVSYPYSVKLDDKTEPLPRLFHANELEKLEE